MGNLLIIIMIGGMYKGISIENVLKYKLFEERYAMNVFTSNFLFSYENKSSKNNFAIYSLEFVASLPISTLSVAAVLFTYAYNPDLGNTLGKVIRDGVYVGLFNAVFIPLSIHLVGIFTNNRGDFLNSMIETFIGTMVGWGTFAYLGWGPPKDGEYILLLPILSAPLGGVIGYNLK